MGGHVALSVLVFHKCPLALSLQGQGSCNSLLGHQCPTPRRRDPLGVITEGAGLGACPQSRWGGRRCSEPQSMPTVLLTHSVIWARFMPCWPQFPRLYNRGGHSLRPCQALLLWSVVTNRKASSRPQDPNLLGAEVSTALSIPGPRLGPAGGRKPPPLHSSSFRKESQDRSLGRVLVLAWEWAPGTRMSAGRDRDRLDMNTHPGQATRMYAHTPHTCTLL